MSLSGEMSDQGLIVAGFERWSDWIVPDKCARERVKESKTKEETVATAERESQRKRSVSVVRC